MKHVTVYDNPGSFAAWPANRGIWSWGDEILVGFTEGIWKRASSGHCIEPECQHHGRLARSLDGGETWFPRPVKSQRAKFEGFDAHHEPINFKAPGFAMTCWMSHFNSGTSFYSFSYNKGKTWSGPYALPMFGFPGVMARTDYQVINKKICRLFLTGAKDRGGEGLAFCVETNDGGLTWHGKGMIAFEIKDRYGDGFTIMPSTVQLDSSEELVCCVRTRNFDGCGLTVCRSENGGQSWDTISKPQSNMERGNPAHMIKLADGRLMITYGAREKPFGIRAMLSEDGGKTWGWELDNGKPVGNELLLRDDGETWDLGYPRTVQRPDGNCVTVYYLNSLKRERSTIEATIWKP